MCFNLLRLGSRWGAGVAFSMYIHMGAFNCKMLMDHLVQVTAQKDPFVKFNRSVGKRYKSFKKN